MRFNSSETYPRLSFKSGLQALGCAHSFRFDRRPDYAEPVKLPLKGVRKYAQWLTLICLRGTLLLLETATKTQDIALSIPKDILLSVKLIAVQRRTSVSGLLTQTLERLVEQEDAYVHARRRHLECLDRGADLDTGGQVTTRRDELHARV